MNPVTGSVQKSDFSREHEISFSKSFNKWLNFYKQWQILQINGIPTLESA